MSKHARTDGTMPANTYITVRDVLERARQFHQRLTEFYDRLNRESERERLRLLLEFMRRHEDNLARSLESYEKEGQERLLESWLQYGPKEDSLKLPPIVEIAADMSLDDIQHVALQFDDALADFYVDAARHVKSKEVRELFHQLVQRHKADKELINTNVDDAKRTIAVDSPV